MKKLKFLPLIVLLFAVLMQGTSNQGPEGINISWGAGIISNGVLTRALSSATTFAAFSFISEKTLTLNAVKVYASAVTATAPSGLQLDIYSDSSTGVPNASLSNTTTITGGVPAAAAWIEFTGLTQTITAGVRYWAVVRNKDASPTVNFVTVQYGASAGGQLHTSSSMSIWGWSKIETTDGSTWITSVGGLVPALRLQFSDGSYTGFSMQALAAEGTNLAFGAHEVGVKFTMPGSSTITYSVVGAGIYKSSNTGTPTGNVRLRLYTGSSSTPTLLATSLGQAVAGNSTTGWHVDYFSSTQNITGGTVVRLTLSDSAADSSSACYRVYAATLENDANSLALAPISGTLQETSTTDGTTFTDTSTKIIPFSLILDRTTPLAKAAAPGAGVTAKKCS